MSYLRWGFTVFAFPLAGVVAMLLVGRSVDPLSSGAAGAVAGAVSWSLGWIVSSFVLTSNFAGWVVFGSSGAVVVTVLTALVLRRILGPRAAQAAPAPTPGAVR